MTPPPPPLRVGIVGLGMIFEETYRPAFEQLRRDGLYQRSTELVEVELAAVASRTGQRADRYRAEGRLGPFASFHGADAIDRLLRHGVDAVCIATPDHRHFEIARAALSAGKHVLIEKPSVLALKEFEELRTLAEQREVLAKVVYHKLLDPDHKKLRTHVADGILQHVNNGYCSLLEPKQISGSQFAEWIEGRNPGTYVAVHYLKLIDFTFFHGTGACLRTITATGQRGLVASPAGPTWDSVQLRLVYQYPDLREAAFDVHTSWVTPENFPGYVEQEVQFRFDNGVWNAHQRKRGVEVTVEGRSPAEIKYTPNHHYNGSFLEPWGKRTQRGYGVETLHRFFGEVAFVEYGGRAEDRGQRLRAMRDLAYNDLTAERNTVAAVQAMEAILEHHAAGRPDGVARFDAATGGLSLWLPGTSRPMVLHPPQNEMGT